ncbi:hypothetical protein EJ04DRAFT_525082 [Polyplosphaeria fusca]|uniref:Uncharacterized protein n=1 Tax=Polyplosphaeria fusca TaxID=682080 RepID=A0A9P4V150_9PLEO|nr:hypothetical protein EJ04DRAFT_525082 [Polyplosphaeria fusca]
MANTAHHGTHRDSYAITDFARAKYKKELAYLSENEPRAAPLVIRGLKSERAELSRKRFKPSRRHQSYKNLSIAVQAYLDKSKAIIDPYEKYHDCLSRLTNTREFVSEEHDIVGDQLRATRAAYESAKTDLRQAEQDYLNAKADHNQYSPARIVGGSSAAAAATATQTASETREKDKPQRLTREQALVQSVMEAVLEPMCSGIEQAVRHTLRKYDEDDESDDDEYGNKDDDHLPKGGIRTV